MKMNIISLILALAVAASAFLVSCGGEKLPGAETDVTQTDAVDENPADTKPSDENPTARRHTRDCADSQHNGGDQLCGAV